MTLLETRSSQYAGLNLNREIEDGILKHSDYHPFDERLLEASLEAQITNIADEIAYTAHDSDDALMADLFSFKELIDIPIAQEAHRRSKQRQTGVRGSIVDLLVSDLVETSNARLLAGSVKGAIDFSDAMRMQLNELRSFLAQHMYMHPRVYNRAIEGQKIIGLLCNYYLEHPNEKILALGQRTGGSLPEAVKDYVAGMTDNFAWLQAAEEGLLQEWVNGEV